jgi:HEAT repeat protein
MGLGAGPAVASLVKALHDKVTTVRLAAAYAIGELGPNHPHALQALINSIHDPDDDIREEVVFPIGEMGSSAKPVMDALQRALKDSSPTVRAAATEAIENLEEDDDDDEPKKENKPAAKNPQLCGRQSVPAELVRIIRG